MLKEGRDKEQVVIDRPSGTIFSLAPALPPTVGKDEDGRFGPIEPVHGDLGSSVVCGLESRSMAGIHEAWEPRVAHPAAQHETGHNQAE